MKTQTISTLLPNHEALQEQAEHGLPELTREVEHALLEDLFKKYFHRVWSLIRRLGVPSDRIDDVAQDTFMIAARKLAAIQAGHERQFLFGIAVKLSANARRANAQERSLRSAESYETLPGRTADELLEQKQARELLDQILDEMPEELRMVFVLVELEAVSIPEIGELLGLPAGTVASRLRRARELFAAAVQRLRARFNFRGARP